MAELQDVALCLTLCDHNNGVCQPVYKLATVSIKKLVVKKTMNV